MVRAEDSGDSGGSGAGGAPDRVREADHWRLMLEVGTEVVAVHDLDGTCLAVAPSSRSVYGVAPEDLVGRPVIGPPTSELPLVATDLAGRLRALPLGGCLVVTGSFVRADGERREGETRLWTRADDDGVVRMIVLTRDVTEQRHAEAALADRAESLRVTLAALQESVTRWEAVRDGDGAITDFRIATSSNPEHAGLGEAGEDIVGRLLMRDYPPFAEGLPLMAGVVETGVPYYAEHASRSGPEGTTRLVSLAMMKVGDGLIASVRDLTERYYAEQALAESEAHYRLLAENSADLITRIAPDDSYLYASPASQGLLGVDPSEMTTATFVTPIHPDDVAAVTEVRDALHHGAPEGRVDYRIRHADGHWVWVETRSRAIRDDAGRLVEVHATSRDITARRAAEEELSRLALTDALTGLANRSLLVDRTEQALARLARHPGRVALLLLDLDRFKAVNDTYGHQVGDEVLRQVAARLRDCARTGDTVGRLGGDEFVLILEELTGVEAAEEVADRVLLALQRPFEVERPAGIGADGSRRVEHLRLTRTGASVGVAVTDSATHGADDLHREADLALYRAKRAGRGRRVTFGSGRADGGRTREAAFARRLAAARADGALDLHFQVVADLRTRLVVGAEALLRFEDPVRGLLAPDTFIDAAEESGVVTDLDAWVLTSALEAVAAWRASPEVRDAVVSVNVSSRTLTRGGYADLVVEELARRSFPAGILRVELTERTLLDPDPTATAELVRLREAGVLLGLDDFGTGLSGMHHLQRFALDFVKIDRTSVAGATEDARSRALLASMIGMVHRLDLPAIAEGVETPEQLATLVELGCDFAQGHLLGHPGPSTDLPARLGQPAF